MTTIDVRLAQLRSAAERVADIWDRLAQWLKSLMPKGLYARSLLIIVTPMVILW